MLHLGGPTGFDADDAKLREGGIGHYGSRTRTRPQVLDEGSHRFRVVWALTRAGTMYSTSPTGWPALWARVVELVRGRAIITRAWRIAQHPMVEGCAPQPGKLGVDRPVRGPASAGLPRRRSPTAHI